MYRYQLIAKRAAVPLLIVVLTAANALAWYSLGTSNAYQDQQNTYAICQRAHNEDNDASEELCGVMQDKTNTEFMCGTYNCWLEIK